MFDDRPQNDHVNLIFYWELVSNKPYSKLAVTDPNLLTRAESACLLRWPNFLHFKKNWAVSIIMHC